MLISLCSPVMNRLDDLKAVMPYRIAAANESPPVELLILDYNSRDGLGEYAQDLTEMTDLEGGSFISYYRYTGREHFHMAHSFNLAMKLGRGEYLVRLGADQYPLAGYLPAVRERIAEGAVWIADKRLCCAVCIERNEFIASGGFDERMELYGPEDRDFQDRLKRRGAQFGQIPDGLLAEIKTPRPVKTVNYRIRGNFTQLSRKMRWIYDENRDRGALTANEGIEWGSL